MWKYCHSLTIRIWIFRPSRICSKWVLDCIWKAKRGLLVKLSRFIVFDLMSVVAEVIFFISNWSDSGSQWLEGKLSSGSCRFSRVVNGQMQGFFLRGLWFLTSCLNWRFFTTMLGKILSTYFWPQRHFNCTMN